MSRSHGRRSRKSSPLFTTGSVLEIKLLVRSRKVTRKARRISRSLEQNRTLYAHRLFGIAVQGSCSTCGLFKHNNLVQNVVRIGEPVMGDRIKEKRFLSRPTGLVEVTYR